MNMHIETPQPSRRRSRTTGAKSATPQALIQMALDRNNDESDAINAIIELAKTSTSLREYLIRSGAKTAVGERYRTDNAKCFRGTPDANVAARPLVMKEPQLVSSDHRVRIIKTAAILQLMAVRLPNRVRMSDAKLADIEHAISVFAPQAQDMLHKAAYYRAVAAKLPDGKRVDEVFTNDSLTSIFEQTRVSA